MRFLCFHGRGANGEILKKQTFKIREQLSQDHDFVFIEGDLPAKPPKPEAFALDTSSSQRTLSFWPPFTTTGHEFRRAYLSLRTFIQNAGPFDAFMGFSEGASVAATILIEDVHRHQSSLRVKCAVFFCAVPPLDLGLDGPSSGPIRPLDPDVDKSILHLPTAHIWSASDDCHPDLGLNLRGLCDRTLREDFMHYLGHDIPGSRSDEGLRETIRAIERTIERAKAS